MLFWFAWTLLNAVHALQAELIHDEAYYWVFSLYPAWGYYDHPPMTAWWIRAGTALLAGELGVRLLFVLAGTLSLWMTWQLCKVAPTRFPLFIALSSALALTHFGGVLAVPDVALGFFTALFWVFLERFLAKDDWLSAIILGVVMAGMAYSKYQGALVVVLAVSALPFLLRSAKAWSAVGTTILLIAPHLWWQQTHEWVTFQFQLFERQGSDPFQWKYIGEFFGGQLGLYGPLMAIPLIWLAFRYRPASALERAMKFNVIGFFVFFFVMSFKGHPEPNWTAPALTPLLVLAVKKLVEAAKSFRWVYAVAAPSVLLLLFGRATMMFDFFPATFFITRQFHGSEAWAQALKAKTNALPAVFSNAYQRPSKYYFYSGVPATTLNDYGRNRRNQFEYLPILESLRGKEVVYMDCPPRDGRYRCDSLVMEDKATYFKHIRNFQVYQHVRMTPVGWPTQMPRDTLLKLPVAIVNHHPFDVDYHACPDFKAVWGIGFSKDKRAGNPTSQQEIPFALHPSGAVLCDTLEVRSPAQPGFYYIVYGIRYDATLPGRNADPFPVEVY